MGIVFNPHSASWSAMLRAMGEGDAEGHGGGVRDQLAMQGVRRRVGRAS